MKLAQLRTVLEAAGQIYRGCGGSAAAVALNEIASLFAEYEAKTVATFVALVEKSKDSATTFDSGRSEEHSDFMVVELRAALDHLRWFSVAAGAKSAATDLKAVSDMLAPYASTSVSAFCADIGARLRASGEKPKRQKKTAATKQAGAGNEAAIARYITELRSAGTDRPAFEVAFERLKSDRSLKAADVGEIARQYATSVTKYKSLAAAHADISKAFVRQARFENKLL
jgi:hypothetical protein